MASIFWDSQGVIMIDYLSKVAHTIDSAYFAGELRPRNARKSQERGEEN